MSTKRDILLENIRVLFAKVLNNSHDKTNLFLGKIIDLIIAHTIFLFDKVSLFYYNIL